MSCACAVTTASGLLYWKNWPRSHCFFCRFAMLIDLVMYKNARRSVEWKFHSPLHRGRLHAIIHANFMGIIFVGSTNNLRLALSLGCGYSMVGMTLSGLNVSI
jgi:hypothetical protein